jgi:hypothetical protein
MTGSTFAIGLLVAQLIGDSFMIEPTSLPLTVGILAGLMWVLE